MCGIAGFFHLNTPKPVDPARVERMCDAIAHRPGLAPALVEKIARTLVDIDPADTEGATILREVFHTSGMLRADLRIYEEVREMLSRAR